MKRLAVLFALLLAPLAAYADPVSALITLAIDYIGTIGVATWIEIGLTVGMAVYGSSQQRKAEQAAKDAYNAGLMDRTVTSIGTDAPYRYIYGEARVGSDIVAMFTAGDKDGLKYLVCVHAAHECQSIEEIYINGEALGSLDVNGFVTTGRYATVNAKSELLVTETHTGPILTLSQSPLNDSSGLTTVRVYTGLAPNMVQIATNSVVGPVVTIPVETSVTVTYYVADGGNQPSVRVEKHLGGATDPVSTLLTGGRVDPGDSNPADQLPVGMWPDTSVLRGFCYTVILLNLNEPSFQTGIPSIQVLIKGKKLYDPRTALTAWSANPALAIRDYLTSPFCGVDATDLPDDQFITAANVCDDATLMAGGQYTFNGTVTADQDQTQTLNAMAQSMAGAIVATTWDIYAGKYVAPVLALSQADIIGSLNISPGISGATIYNGIKGQYVDATNDYVVTDFPQYQNAVYRATDGQDYFANINFPFTNDLQRVYNLCRIFTEDQRNGFTIKAEFSLKAWSLKIGQRVTFDSAFIGQTAKIYRVTDKAYSPNSAVMMTLKEDDPSIWDNSDAVTAAIGPTSNLPNPWLISPLASLTCASSDATVLTQADGTIVPRILATWPTIAQQAVFSHGSIEIDWCAVGDTSWNILTLSGDSTQAYLFPVVAGVFYNIRARVIDNYLNVKSAWIYAYSVGVATPPTMAAVTGLELFGQGNNTVFTGLNAKFDWRFNSSTTSFEVGSEPVGNAGSVGPQFKDYEVRIYTVGLVLLRTDHTTDNTYTYTYEMNFVDSGGAPNRTFTIKVYERGTEGQLSTTPATLTASNPAPDAPSGLYATPGPSSIAIGATKPNITDLAGMIIWASTSTGFTPGSGNQIYKGLGNSFNYTGLTPYIPIYIRVAFYDTFDSAVGSLNLSTEVSAIPTSSGVLVVSTLPGSGAFVGEVVYLSSDSNLYRWNGSAWTTAVTAAQITGLLADSQIAAIAASKLTGTITTTQITNNAITTPLLAAGAVTTGTIASGAISATTIAAGAVTTSALASGSVSTAVLQAGAVTASKVSIATLDAISGNFGTMTSGTIVGTVIETASSGARITLNDAGNANCFASYNSSGVQTVTIGGNYGIISATTASGLVPAITGTQTGTTSCGVYGNNTGNGSGVIGQSVGGAGGNFVTSGSNTTVVVNDTGADGANIFFVGNGGTTPNKYIRAFGGKFSVVNSGYTAEILTLTDAGAFSIPAGFGCNGKGPQSAVSSSGATLSTVIAALVANGIMS